MLALKLYRVPRHPDLHKIGSTKCLFIASRAKCSIITGQRGGANCLILVLKRKDLDFTNLPQEQHNRTRILQIASKGFFFTVNQPDATSSNPALLPIFAGINGTMQ